MRENFLLYSSNLLLGFPTGQLFYFIKKRNQAFWHHHHRAINKFSGAVAGKKKDFCKESFAHTSFTLFLVLLYFIFTCIIFIKNTKKLVPTIVAIFVGLLLSCFIMLSINGWFL
jgi:hypothetical protein